MYYRKKCMKNKIYKPNPGFPFLSFRTSGRVSAKGIFLVKKEKVPVPGKKIQGIQFLLFILFYLFFLYLSPVLRLC